MKEQHEIVNDFKLDAVKDNFKPPSMEEISERAVTELFDRLDLDKVLLERYVDEFSEYHIDEGVNYYLIKDLAHVLKVLIPLRSLK